MSTIAVDNARPSAGGTAYSLTNGVAKAFAAYTQTGTQSLDDSENISSITDEGTGDSRFTYTNNFDSAIYAAQAQGKRGAQFLASVAGIRDTPSSASTPIVHDNGAGGPQDCNYCGYCVMGDLA